MSLHLSAPVHVFASQLVNVSPPQLLLLLSELLCLLSLEWKKKHHNWKTFLSGHYI